MHSTSVVAPQGREPGRAERVGAGGEGTGRYTNWAGPA